MSEAPLQPQTPDPDPSGGSPLPVVSRPTAWREVRTPGWIRWTASRMLLLLLLLLLVFAFVPWQQTATGAGKVIAYVPSTNIWVKDGDPHRIRIEPLDEDGLRAALTA